MSYVVYLDSRTDIWGESNEYGYWKGTGHIFKGENYPNTDRHVTDETKIYRSRKRAENSLEKCIEKYIFVNGGKVYQAVTQSPDDFKNS